MEIPSVYVVFLQLTKPGPSATQNFPLLHFFLSVAMMTGRFYTPYDVKCTNLHILTVWTVAHFSLELANFEARKNYCPLTQSLDSQITNQCNIDFNFLGKKGSKISFHRHFNLAYQLELTDLCLN